MNITRSRNNCAIFLFWSHSETAITHFITPHQPKKCREKDEILIDQENISSYLNRELFRFHRKKYGSKTYVNQFYVNSKPMKRISLRHSVSILTYIFT